MNKTKPSTPKSSYPVPTPGHSVTLPIDAWPEHSKKHGLKVVSVSWDGNGPLKVEIVVRGDGG